MLFADDRRNTVIDVVVGQDSAQELLFSLDGMRHRVRRLDFGPGRIESRYLVHLPLVSFVFLPVCGA